MNEDVLNTLLYLTLVLIGATTIYLTTTKDNIEIKKLALRIYPLMLFLIVGITFLIHGVNNTKKAIGYIIGESVFFIFFLILFLAICMLILLAILTNWKFVFEDIKKYFQRKSK